MGRYAFRRSGNTSGPFEKLYFETPSETGIGGARGAGLDVCVWTGGAGWGVGYCVGCCARAGETGAVASSPANNTANSGRANNSFIVLLTLEFCPVGRLN